MTAMPEEVEGAIAEGCELLDLHAPLRIEKDENGNVAAVWVKPPDHRTGQERKGRCPWILPRRMCVWPAIW